jgi:hypothetical protein
MLALPYNRSSIDRYVPEMPKKSEIGDKLFVVLKKDKVRIFEDGTKKMTQFTYPRWA